MKADPYLSQILIVIAKGCKLESPIPDRAWMNLKPRGGKIPGLGAALDALVRAGLVERLKGRAWQVRPSRIGYAFVESWKEDRRAMRARPVLFDPVVKELEPVTILDQRFDRYRGYDHNTHQLMA